MKLLMCLACTAGNGSCPGSAVSTLAMPPRTTTWHSSSEVRLGGGVTPPAVSVCVRANAYSANCVLLLCGPVFAVESVFGCLFVNLLVCLSIFISLSLSVSRSVGRSVGWLVGRSVGRSVGYKQFEDFEMLCASNFHGAIA